MTESAHLPDGLIDYFAARAAQRAAEVESVLRGLTKREQQLIREAAIMGYVQGTMAPRCDSLSAAGRSIPPDSQVLAGVITGCLGIPDLYPAMKRARRRGEARARSFTEGEG